MKKIKSITEAFSMQPETLSVTSKEQYDKYKNSEWTVSMIATLVEKIEFQYNGEQNGVYIGYNFDGKKVFEYLTKSVNVQYFID